MSLKTQMQSDLSIIFSTDDFAEEISSVTHAKTMIVHIEQVSDPFQQTPATAAMWKMTYKMSDAVSLSDEFSYKSQSLICDKIEYKDEIVGVAILRGKMRTRA